MGYGSWRLPLGLSLLGSADFGARRKNFILERQRRIAIGPLPDPPRYAAKRRLLRPDAHEIVSKIGAFQGVGGPSWRWKPGCGASLQLSQPTPSFPGRGAAPVRWCTAEPGSIAAMAKHGPRISSTSRRKSGPLRSVRGTLACLTPPR